MPERPTSAFGVYSPRPTIRVDAQEHPRIGELLLSMEMTEREGGLSALELRVSNVASDTAGHAALAFEDDAVLRLGARIAVYAGDEAQPREIFQGAITGLEADFPVNGAPALVALAEDAFQRARMTRHTRVHEDVTIAEVARALASELGLTPVITGLTDNIGTQVQLDESDLAFLRRLLARFDADVQVVGSELHVSPRGDVARGTLELELHSQLRRARVLADLAHQVTEVTVSGWNAAQGERVSGSSTGASLGPGRGRTGAQLLESALGERAQLVSHLAVGTDAEARAAAAAAFDGRARRFLVLDGTAEGNAALRVGTSVTVRGLGARFDNTYYVTLARHRFDRERGYETDFTAECAYWGGRG